MNIFFIIDIMVTSVFNLLIHVIPFLLRFT